MLLTYVTLITVSRNISARIKVFLQFLLYKKCGNLVCGVVCRNHDYPRHFSAMRQRLLHLPTLPKSHRITINLHTNIGHNYQQYRKLFYLTLPNLANFLTVLLLQQSRADLFIPQLTIQWSPTEKIKHQIHLVPMVFT